MYMFGRAWFVGDSGLGQAGEGSTGALQDATDSSGLMYYFLGLAGKHEGAAGVTAGVQTPATFVVGAAKATRNRNALSGSNLRVLRV